MKNFATFFSVCFFAALFSACNEPSPIVGKWQDNENTITFTSEGTFTLKLADGITRDGEYSMSNNVIVLNFSDGQTELSEWDIRGSVLYFYSYDSEDPQKPASTMILYKVG